MVPCLRHLCLLILPIAALGTLNAQEFYGGGVSANAAGRVGIYTPSIDDVLDAFALNPGPFLGIPFQPHFAYHARMQINLPQSASLSALWQVDPLWRLTFESDWTDWNRAFHGERFSWSGGFLHSNNPLPRSTPSPLTTAILQNGLTTGFGYRAGRYGFNIAYGVDLAATSQVGTSALLSGEYSDSRTKVGTQSLTFGALFRL